MTDSPIPPPPRSSPPPNPEKPVIARPRFSRGDDRASPPAATSAQSPGQSRAQPANRRGAETGWSAAPTHTRRAPDDSGWAAVTQPIPRPEPVRTIRRTPQRPAPSIGLLVVHALPTSFHLFFFCGMLLSILDSPDSAPALGVPAAVLLTGLMHWRLRTANQGVRLVLLILASIGNLIFAALYLLAIFAVLNTPYAALALIALLLLFITGVGIAGGIYHEVRLQQSLRSTAPRARPAPKVKLEPEMEIAGDWDQAKPRTPGRLPRR